jgi:hypothetical protein
MGSRLPAPAPPPPPPPRQQAPPETLAGNVASAARAGLGLLWAGISVVFWLAVGGIGLYTMWGTSCSGPSALEKDGEALAGAVRGICTTQYSKPWPDTPVAVENDTVTAWVALTFQPQNYEQVQMVSDAICTGIVKMLVQAGYNPREKMISVFVHVRAPNTGVSVTGQPMVTKLGRSMYSFASDDVTFVPDM